MIRVREPGLLTLAVLASGRGSNFDALYAAIQRQDLHAVIRILVSDNPEAGAIKKARQRGITALVLNPADFSNRRSYEEALIRALQEQEVDMVALAGYMRLVGRDFLQAFRHRVVNIHPALLPSFMGLHAQKQAVDYGVCFSGCTVHIVDEGMDTGPIILQKVVPVFQDDDEESLALRILAEEHQAYWQALQLLAEGRIYLDGRKVVVSEIGKGMDL
ncbi:MAG TPA: phosphoribosylglycinamide formyltransferase [Syntrophomonadaceae bacterium]|nr:phosphoribosylglycinamide formyltransferase [Syntrophomonadaceae bacterium]